MKKLPTGTKNTATRGFSASDICRIISVCEKSRVSRLKIGDLFVTFDSGSAVPSGPDKNPVPLSDVPTDAEPVVHELEQVNARRIREDERIAQLMVDDPQGYEQEIIDGFLDEESGNDGSDEFDDREKEIGSGSQSHL